jgi:hypothetical protein
MDKQELLQKLSEVAEWQMPKLTPSDIKISKQRGRGKGRPSNEDKYQEEHEEVFLDLFQGINPTMSPELVKVKIKSKDCEDCGIHLAEGRQMQIKFYPATPGHIAHRRERCMNCKQYKDPYTGRFELAMGPACQQYLNWARSEFSVRNKLAKKSQD